MTNNNSKKKLYVGLMSGTSLDGIDASIIETDGENLLKIIGNLHLPYSVDFVQKLRKLIATQEGANVVEDKLSRLHAEAVNELLKITNTPASLVRAIGFHGQTINHEPDKGITRQIGDPGILTAATGIDVVYNFRQADVKKGGQGAPLIPVYHRCIARNADRPVVILNIGGVANLTYIGPDDELIAFDTGPGNALINDIVEQYYSKPYDEDGRIASEGTVIQDQLDSWLEDHYFKQSYPKSLDRNHFKQLIASSKDTAPKDFITTLSHFTVESVMAGIALLPKQPQQIYVCGGGAKNKYLMQLINSRLAVKDIKKLGDYDPDHIESQGFAYLAARCIRGLPSTFPETTGVNEELVAGVLVKA